MAITVPTDYIVIDPQTLTGRVPFSELPLKNMLKNTNWMYARHSPALVNAGLDSTGIPNPREYIMPAVVSADGLQYELITHVYSSAAATLTINVYERAADSTGAWGAATTTLTPAVLATTDQWITGALTAFATTTRYLKVEYSMSSGGCQPHSILIRPKVPLTVAAGLKASGFYGFDDAALPTPQTGEPIHTEYFNRAHHNYSAILMDRRQAFLGYCGDVPRLRTWNATTTLVSRPVVFGPCHIAGQAGATVTFRVRADDPAGGATIRGGFVDGGSFSLAADDTDRTATLVLPSDTPEIWIQAQPNAGGAGTDIYYITADWRPGD